MKAGQKKLLERISLKQLCFFSIVLGSLLLFSGLTIWSGQKVKKLDSQQAAARWDKEGKSAQVSCFFSEQVTVDEMQLTGFRKTLEQSLKSVLSEDAVKEQNDRRLVVDAYSILGNLTISSEYGSLEADAVGIGGDFFLFHPLELVSGGYFSGNDLMKDFVILDEEAAWQLFGSNDIAGQSVTISGVPHYVQGVVRRQEGSFAEAAGLDKSVIYVSAESLTAYGTAGQISTYEIVAPNPVEGYVTGVVKEKLGVEEADMLVVENSSRYSAKALLLVILDFGTRSMQNRAIRFPYWENIARGWEDVMALVLIAKFLFLLIPAVIVCSFLIIKWKGRSFTKRDVWEYIVEKKDRTILYLREKSTNVEEKSKKGGRP